MFLLYDALALQSATSRTRGIGRFAANLLAGIRAARPNWDVRVLVHGYLQPPDADLIAGLKTHVYDAPFPIEPACEDANDRYLADWIGALRPDWVLHPSAFEPTGAFPRYAGHDVRSCVLMHDLIPLAFNSVYKVSEPGWEWYGRRVRAVCRTDLLIANSAFTATDTQRLLGADCPPAVNVRGAADPSFRPVPAGELPAREAAIRAKFHLPKPFLLYVGADDPRKNMSGTIAGYAALPAVTRAGIDLLLACKLPQLVRDQLADEAKQLGVGDQVKFTGFVSDDDLRVLYQICRVFFFPSFSEGLGLPVVEAMRCGAPVVAADNSSLPEYAGPVSWYCDPSDPASMATALVTALAEPKNAREAERVAFAGEFCWIDTGTRAAVAIEKFTPKPVVPAKPRLAWVAPSANGTTTLALGLTDRYDVEWVTSDDEYPPLEVTGQFRVIREKELALRHAARPFDLFVHHIGGDPGSAFAVRAAVRHPGILVATDAALASPSHLIPPSVYAAAYGIIAPTPAAWALARRLTAAPVVLAPLTGRLTTLPDAQSERRRRLIPNDRIVVVVVGSPGPLADMIPLVRSLADLPEDIAVVVAGPLRSEDRIAWNHLVDESRVGCSVTLGGPDICDAEAWVAVADVCIAMADLPLAAPSGWVPRLLAAGKVVVTWDACLAGMPPGVLVPVRSPAAVPTDLAVALGRLIGDAGRRSELSAAARAYAADNYVSTAAIARVAAVCEMAAAALAGSDIAWRSDVANALADTKRSVPTEVIANWARLRTAAVTDPADALPDLPEVPATRTAADRQAA